MLIRLQTRPLRNNERDKRRNGSSAAAVLRVRNSGAGIAQGPITDAVAIPERRIRDLQSGTHLRAANRIISRPSRTIDLRGFNWQAFCSKGHRSDPLRSNAAAIFQSYLKNGLLH
jgi:hypothetical protein